MILIKSSGILARVLIHFILPCHNHYNCFYPSLISRGTTNLPKMSHDNREPAASSQVEPPAELMGNGELHGERHMFDLVTTVWRRLKEKLHTSNSNETIGRNTAGEPHMAQIEDYRPGYPQFSALVGSHASFQVCRRFLRVRARLLLLKQDELSLLESQLDRIDHNETRELFLGNRRRDTNGERREILEKLDAALADYDALLDRNRRILACNDPSRECVMNLQHWVDNTCSLAQCETAYLAYTKDLMTILSTQDDAVARLAPLMETILRSLYKIVGKLCCGT